LLENNVSETLFLKTGEVIGYGGRALCLQVTPATTNWSLAIYILLGNEGLLQGSWRQIPNNSYIGRYCVLPTVTKGKLEQAFKRKFGDAQKGRPVMSVGSGV
jgi:hypothetical protein